MSNDRKATTLGMPHGTATGRLRKNILFHLLKKHGENCCFKCAKPIEAVEDLSIEHKKPWEGISAELFWDLENIAFSHIACNRPHRNGGGRFPRAPISEGMSWCRGHKALVPIIEFSPMPSRWNGLSLICRSCRNATRRQSPDS